MLLLDLSHRDHLENIIWIATAVDTILKKKISLEKTVSFIFFSKSAIKLDHT